jgi:flagellar biosynthesis protein FliP
MENFSEQNRSGVRPASGRLLAAAALLAATALPAGAQDAAGLLQSLSGALSESGGEATGSLSGRIIQMIALITVLSLAPALVIMMTSFTRFVIVFSMLRSALGLNQTPPNMVITSLALFMTFFVMQPVFEESWEKGLSPLIENRITEEEALPLIAAPFKEFMFAHARPQDLELFHDVAMRNAGQEAAPLPQTAEEAGWASLVPAFMISELRRAFLIGFLIYLPFLAIDLIVAAILMSAGMMMLPPVLISLPFKVIFFVLIDGWYMIAGSLLASYFAS